MVAQSAVARRGVHLLKDTNFSTPNTTLAGTADPKTGKGAFNSPDFGIITAARAARFFQLEARFDF